MKRYRLMVPPDVELFIRHLHPLLKSKIHKALGEIERNPFQGKALKEPLEGLYSYRVSRYRIIYEIKRKEILVEVVDIGERKIIYSKVAALLRKILS